MDLLRVSLKLKIINLFLKQNVVYISYLYLCELSYKDFRTRKYKEITRDFYD